MKAGKSWKGFSKESEMPVYLNFFHGRHTSDEELDDWGFNGPVFGPFSTVQVTYGCHIKTIDREGDLTQFTIDKDGLVEALGAFYGDFEIVDVKTFKRGFKNRWKETKRILAVPEKDFPLYLNEKEDWIKTYIERSLKNDPGKSPAPRRSRDRKPSRSRRKSP